MNQKKLVDDWNRQHAVGTPVTRYKLINPLRDPTETRTRSAAWLMGGHTAVVLCDGLAGSVMVDALVVRDDAPIFHPTVSSES